MVPCSAIGVFFLVCGTLFRDWRFISCLRNPVPRLAIYFAFAEQNTGFVPRLAYFFWFAELSSAIGDLFRVCGTKHRICSAIGVFFLVCGTLFRDWRFISRLRNKTQDLFRD